MNWVLPLIVGYYFIPAHFTDRPDLNGWFDGLRSERGMCCSYADGRSLVPSDVDTDGGHYRVRLDDQWVDVPDGALVTVPNRYGEPIVWPFKDSVGKWQIRCFLPGAGI